MRLHSRRAPHFAAAIALAIAPTLLAFVPANADTTTPDQQGVVSQETTTNQNCLTQIQAAIAAGDTQLSTDVCTSTLTLTAGAPQTVTVAQAQTAAASLSPSEGAALVAAAAAGTVHSKSYGQQHNNITDSETQKGTFYYDGSHAWVTVTYRGDTGTHNCVVDWEVGYVVSNDSCTDSGTTSKRTLQGTWFFAPAGVDAAGWSETYTMYVNSAGTISQ